MPYRASIIFMIGLKLLILGPGCAWLKPRPYEKNPLVQRGRAVLGDPFSPTQALPWNEPLPPAPPIETLPVPHAKDAVVLQKASHKIR